MKLLKYSPAIVALALFASPAFADCQARLSQIENMPGITLPASRCACMGLPS